MTMPEALLLIFSSISIHILHTKDDFKMRYNLAATLISIHILHTKDD